ncbi:MAG: magnesium transporter [Treponema sp.]|nr:magnesium transporter [Treponema sp.]
MKKLILFLLEAESPGTARNILKLKNMLSDLNTQDICDIFNELRVDKIIKIFRILPKAVAADVFAHIDSEHQQILVQALSDDEIGELMSRLFVDDAVDFIEEMPANVVKRVLMNVSQEKRTEINRILQYPEDSAGSIMTTEYVDLSEDINVRKAFYIIRSTGVTKETIYNCYVIREDRLLVGVVSAKALMLANSNDRIGDIMDASPVFAHTTDDREAVADKFRKYGLLAMPVVDTEQRLVGIITVDDIIEVIVEESTEDMEKMGALTPSDDPYLKTGIIRLAKNRIVWLMILMLSATISAGIIATYEESLAILPILVAFIPMLMDSAGNAGCQSSTLIIRGMAVGEIRLRDFFRVLWREIRVGTLCGLALSLVNLVRIYLMYGQNIMLALTVTLSLFCTILMAKTLGGLLPILAKRVKLDPALMAAPLITTMCDAACLMIYFSMAKMILGL